LRRYEYINRFARLNRHPCAVVTVPNRSIRIHSNWTMPLNALVEKLLLQKESILKEIVSTGLQGVRVDPLKELARGLG
jgi:hypothetical protein